jgi:hypothetical protein
MIKHAVGAVVAVCVLSALAPGAARSTGVEMTDVVSRREFCAALSESVGALHTNPGQARAQLGLLTTWAARGSERAVEKFSNSAADTLVDAGAQKALDGLLIRMCPPFKK